MYEERTNGTHAIHCDTPDCHIELIAPSKQEVYEDFNLAGWSRQKDQAGDDVHVCHHCGKGTHPGAAVLKSMIGGDSIAIPAPFNVNRGDEVRDDDGNLIGHYKTDAIQGDEVDVKLEFPKPQAPVSGRVKFAAMMEGSDDDSGVRSVVAPGDDPGHVAQVAPTVVPGAPAPPPPKPGSLASAPGSDGGSGVVRKSPKPDTTSPQAQAAMQRAPAAPKGPRIDTATMDETTAIFDGIAWDPDDAD